ncbi:Transglutaminase-like enzyme, putative cysteine protease [Paenibacillus algorifonticola]|uniref:Transglutaminase-like enzyme, putative cysteine protease n=1 Tax=Paenibacillus algorifonticola TaxID=684063 RepID=A0A1I2BA09_9BACL|nr:transglutaminase family protein [Paenibacillus algorifonticola]SFE52817.1 Transglutaminase-like enzyme, putative cysteine protease [Paenibacillus algorifonticola]
MKLNISHVTQYDYGTSVTDSVNEIRLTPSTNERQSCYQQSIAIEPNAPLFSYEDFFGNRVHSFSVNGLHRKLTIRSQMTVVTKEALTPEQQAAALNGGGAAEVAWEWLQSEDAGNRFVEFLLPTAYTALSPEVETYAVGIEDRNNNGLSVYGWLLALSQKIRTEFVYDPDATTVETKASDMFERRRGVCQDFAHLMIACCRSQQVPARYVSGYHFVGDLQGGTADFEQASHAWVEAYVPSLGWCSFDPTNEAPVGERYVKLGHGRDYKDIVPVKGVYRGSGQQTLKVTVDVRKVEE